MATQPRADARRHYEAAERLADSVPETPGNALQLALVHATLAGVDPRKLRQRKPATPPPSSGDSSARDWGWPS